MIDFQDLQRILQPIKRQIFLLIGRAILKAIDNNGDVQRLKITMLKDETASNVERWQEYGFETYPEDGAEALPLSPAGDRGRVFVGCVRDRRYRPKGSAMSVGDVMMYTRANEREDGTPGVGFRTWMQDATGTIQQDCDTRQFWARLNEIIKAEVGRQIETPLTEHTGNYLITGNLEVTGNILSSGGNISAPTGDVSDKVRSMAGDRAIYNIHQHPENFTGITTFTAPPTDPPTQQQ